MTQAPATKTPQTIDTVAVALGGGGARGFSHVLVIEAFDELGIRPGHIAGTSIGAVIGAVWAAGMPAEDMRDYLTGLLRNRADIIAKLVGARAGKFSDMFSGKLANTILLDPEKVLDLFWPKIVPDRFDQLSCQFSVVATDFYARRPLVFNSGPLVPAVAASMAIPGVFKPVEAEACVLVDGGIVNPLPFDLLEKSGVFTIACDVTGGPVAGKRAAPQPIEALLGASQIMQSAITAQMLKSHTPGLLIRPPVDDFRLLDFFRAEKIMTAAEPIKDDVKRAVDRFLKVNN